MAKNTRGTHSELVHCDNCGEDFSATYKRCPFCGARPDKTGYTQPIGRFDMTGRTSSEGRRSSRPQEDTDRAPSRSRARPQDEDDYVFDGGDVFDDEDDDDDYYTGRRGGKRLIGGGFDISPTTIAGIVFSIVIIIAAILVVALVIVPMVQSGRTPTASNSPNPSLTGSPNNSSPITGSPSLPASPSGNPDDPDGTTTPTTSPDPSTSPSVPVSTPPASGSFTLLNYRNRPVEDFTISDRYPDPVQLKVSGASGAVTWTSSNESVATVSSGGVVTAVSKGNATITATDSTGQSRTCRVIVSITGGAAVSPSPSASAQPSGDPQPSTSSSGSLTLNKTDITINDRWPDPVTLKPSGASGAVSWTSSRPEVATVDANGKVTRVGKGNATITATDANGNKATCIVRCG